MAVQIVARKFADGMKYLRIRAAGYTFYSQNTLLAVLIEASGCKKCSQILKKGFKVMNIYNLHMELIFVINFYL